jgi:hypothetical protein
MRVSVFIPSPGLNGRKYIAPPPVTLAGFPSEYDNRLPALCDSTLPVHPKAGTIPIDMTAFLAAVLIGMLLP